MSRPRLLDLFCGAGGAAMGYHRAGFEVVGVDIKPQPHYPFDFHQADALEILRTGGWGHGHKHRFDAIHASPPCQPYSRMSNSRPGSADNYPKLIESVRALLQATALPCVIENVPGAPLINPLMLCGTMFDLRVYRHRLFEINPPIYFPPHPCAHVATMPRAGRLHADGWYSVAGHVAMKPAAAAMGIDWMQNSDEISEAIPPAYTEWIGTQLLAALRVAA